jgi:hypothetical protein
MALRGSLLNEWADDDADVHGDFRWTLTDQLHVTLGRGAV